MPASLKLQAQFGDDLQVLFVESQGATPAEAAAFVLKLKWLGGRGMWTSEHPCDSGSRSLPSAVLLGSDGKVLFNGNPLDGHKEIVRLVENDAKTRRDPPSDLPKALQAAWSAYAKGKIGEALRQMDALGEKEKAAAADAFTHARAEIVARTQAAIGRARWNLEHGYPDECAQRLDALAKACEGSSEFKAALEELRARLSSPEGSAEREAFKVLGRLEAKFCETGGDEAARKDLERVCAKHAGTKVAERMRALLALGAK